MTPATCQTLRVTCQRLFVAEGFDGAFAGGFDGWGQAEDDASGAMKVPVDVKKQLYEQMNGPDKPRSR